MNAIQKKIYGIVDDWTALGVGKAVDGDNEVYVTHTHNANRVTRYFVVLDWKSANEMRKSMGLSPKDFHITLGFKEKVICEHLSR